MALQLAQKKEIVAQVAEIASNAVSAIAAEYRGLTVAEMTELRTNARQAGIHVKVAPNTLAKRAMQDTSFNCMQDELVGPIVLIFSPEDPGIAARVVRDFAKDHENLIVKALSIGGQLYAAAELKNIANLPTRDQAISQLMSVMLAPVTQLARTMTETYAQLVRVLSAVGEQKQA